MDFRSRFPLRLWRPAVEEEVDEELGFHLAMRERELIARGLSPDEAHRAALARFGDLERARVACRAISHQRERHMRLLQYLLELRQDAVFALRQLRAAPGFAALALVTLALGIGMTSAIFSVVHAVVLRQLPVSDPDRLVLIESGWREGRMPVAPGHYLHLAAEQTAFHSVAAADWQSLTLGGPEGPERVIAARVTGRFFEVFGVQPSRGTTFGHASDRFGAEPVVVLGHALWTRSFGGDEAIVGRSVILDGRPHTVLGVMPDSFEFSARGEQLWVPMAFPPAEAASRSSHYLAVYGRLAEGISVEQADQQVSGLVARRVTLWPDESADRTMHATPLMDAYVGDYRARLFFLLGAVGLVLLIACGNVANLLLARGAVRTRELSVRAALGAGQGRLVRQLLTESAVLGAAGAAAGLVLARVVVELLLAYGPAGVPRLQEARIDLAVVAFAAVLGIVSSLIFGVVPAWRTARADVNETLKDAGRGSVAHGPRDTVRSALVAGEVALSLVLLVSAGLFIRSALEMQRLELGFEPRGVFSGRLLLPGGDPVNPAARLALAEAVQARIGVLPGVEAAAMASTVPGVRSFSNGLLPEGRALLLENVTQTDGVIVSPNYFDVMGLPVRRGRAFTDADRVGSPLVVILNETAARRMWPGEDPIGKRLSSAHPLGLTTVIGIVPDVRAWGLDQPPPPTFYVPIAQLDAEMWAGMRAPFVVARTAGDPAALGPVVRRAVTEIDPGVPLFALATMEARMAATLESERFNRMLLVWLGLTGLVLAVAGIYGVVSYFAAQRTGEIGLRIALGASRQDIVRLVAGQALRPVGAGIALGALGALAAVQALQASLVNVSPYDPLTFAVVAVGLGGVAFGAALVPARKAAALDPQRAMHA